MKNIEIYKPIKQKLDIMENQLIALLSDEAPLISKTIPHILKAGGKRLRPALLLLAAKICNYTGERDIKHALIIELIHTASLIHDDVLDNDTLRRGVPTINSQYGSNITVILGDFLYTYVFNILAEDGDIDIIRCIASTTNRMARGDLRQLYSKYEMGLTEEKYILINIDKTASLMATACRIGALLGQAKKEEVEVLTRYGLNLGIAFQITDDLLDLTADQKVLGKPIGSDIREGKLTLPIIHTLNNADSNDRQWIMDTLRSSEQIDTISLKKALELVRQYGGIEYSLNKAKEYIGMCKHDLSIFKPTEETDTLTLFADYIIERVY